MRNQHFLQVDNIVFYVIAIPKSLMSEVTYQMDFSFHWPCLINHIQHDRHPLSLMAAGQFDGQVQIESPPWNRIMNKCIWIFVVRIGYSCPCSNGSEGWVIVVDLDFRGCLNWNEAFALLGNAHAARLAPLCELSPLDFNRNNQRDRAVHFNSFCSSHRVRF